MIDRVTPHLVELVYNAALVSFWRKEALRKFLRTCNVSEGFLATWSSEETKRSFLDRLFIELQRSEKGRNGILKIAEFLSEQNTFPDLRGWEDSDKKIRDAHEAIGQLRRYIREQQEQLQSQEDREEARKKFTIHQQNIKQSQQHLDELNKRLAEISKEIGTAKAGYAFQTWFYDLLDYCEVVNRRPYTHEGRQIDGSLTVSGTTYLVELKFTSTQAEAPDIDSLFKKVTDVADNTMGIMVSISGYSTIAKKVASGRKTPLLLMDAQHLYLVLLVTNRFDDLVDRIRRHASQTGEAYLHPDQIVSN